MSHLLVWQYAFNQRYLIDINSIRPESGPCSAAISNVYDFIVDFISLSYESLHGGACQKTLFVAEIRYARSKSTFIRPMGVLFVSISTTADRWRFTPNNSTCEYSLAGTGQTII